MKFSSSYFLLAALALVACDKKASESDGGGSSSEGGSTGDGGSVAQGAGTGEGANSGDGAATGEGANSGEGASGEGAGNPGSECDGQGECDGCGQCAQMDEAICKPAVDACVNDEGCFAFEKCYVDCAADTTCQQDCVKAASPETLQIVLDIDGCIRDACAQDCDTGGECTSDTSCTECSQCASTIDCKDEVQACAAVEGCLGISECLNGCGQDQACGEACLNDAPEDASAAFGPAYTCLLQTCSGCTP